MPVRVTRSRAEAQAPPTGPTLNHLEETAGTMRIRVRRLLESEAAWAEDPPSRTRRFVTNLRVRPVGPDEMEARTYLLLVRSRFDEVDFELLSDERLDVLTRVDGRWLLRRREVLLDQTRLGNINLALFY
jgi:3-phenylpropionate/cinnamic acid dioxygenase small subunit